jgi:hypothetical protein
MIIALLIVIIILLGYENYQIFKTWTEPRLTHNRLEMEKIYKMYEELEKKKIKNKKNV